MGRRLDRGYLYQALRTLTPFFLRLSAAFEAWIGTIARSGLGFAEVAGIEPDSKLVEPIATALQTLQREEPRDSSSLRSAPLAKPLRPNTLGSTAQDRCAVPMSIARGMLR